MSQKKVKNYLYFFVFYTVLYEFMVKIDLHVHTKYSFDSIIFLPALAKICYKHNMSVAITDHATIKGAIKLQSEYKNLKIIIGEEIYTNVGEVIGLFLQKEIQKNELFEVIDEIKAQNGLIYVPHPFDSVRKGTIKTKNLLFADIIEVYNSRTIFEKDNKLAYAYASKNSLLKVCGSDAHTPIEIANAYIQCDEFSDKSEFLCCLQNAKLYFKKTNPLMHLISKSLSTTTLFKK